MLQAIRDRIMGIAGWIVLGLLIVAFAFWGVNSYLQTDSENFAAKVNDIEISNGTLQSTYEQTLARMRQALGNNFDPELINDALIRTSALTQLINEELFSQAADDAGLSVSDSALSATISSFNEFKQDGAFAKARYTQVLRYQGITPGQFEARMRRDLASDQLKTSIQLTAAGTEDELRKAFALQAQQRRFDYLVLPESTVADQVSLSDAEISSYYQDHGDSFRTPERVRLQYVELDAGDLKVDQPVDEEQLKALYAEHQDRYVTPEQRHARHILIAVNGKDDAAVAAARSKAEGVLKRLAAAEDFAKLAGELSDDPGSAKSGGDLGTFGKGVMVPEFEQAVFGMKKGDKPQLVQSSYGFHIIDLLDIVPEVAKPMAEVRDELVNEQFAEARSDLYAEKLETLTNLAFEQPDSLQGVAKALDLKIQESDWISRDGGSGIGANPKVVSAAFGEDVIGNGNNSQPVEIGDDHVVVLRVLEHQQSTLPPLEAVKQQVSDAAHREALDKLLQAKGDELLNELNSGKSGLDTLAQAQKVELQHGTLLARNARQPSALMVSRAFALPRPEDGKPVYTGFLQPEGGYVLLALAEVQDGNFDALPEAARKQALRSLNEMLGDDEMQMVLGELQAGASIHIPETDAR